MTSKPYNGHKSYNFWNVSLWLNNDQGLYNELNYHLDNYLTKEQAAAAMLLFLKQQEVTHTPDGVRYSEGAIRAAMVGL